MNSTKIPNYFGEDYRPTIPKGQNRRELIDIFINGEEVGVIIESKSLALYSRDIMPLRAKLKKNLTSSIHKGFKQLTGAMRRLREGVELKSESSEPITLNRAVEFHAIVLVPDLDLIDPKDDYDAAFIGTLMEESGAFIHLLDISELLRIVQVTEHIYDQRITKTKLAAFDMVLKRRLEIALNSNSLVFEVVTHF